MPNVLTLVAAPQVAPLDPTTTALAVEALAALGFKPQKLRWLAPDEACEVVFDGDAVAARVRIAEVLDGKPVDHAILPTENRRKRLLIADMDSTILLGETLDELATIAGVGEAVVAITMRSMRGELDFAEALRERVAMLKGASADLLKQAADDMRVTPGAKALVRTMRANGAYTALVSGGFTYFTALVRQDVGFDLDLANTLEVDGDTLKGTVTEPILTREVKRETLLRLAKEGGLAPEDALAVGDGANDLAMIQTAGLGVAYRAKPVVAAAADARVEHGDLTALLYFQGYAKADFVL